MTARRIRDSWWVDFRVAHVRYRKRSPEDSRAGAQAYEAMLRQRAARGESIDDIIKESSPKLTFAQFIPEWLDTYVAANCKNSEILAKESVLRSSLLPWFGEYPLGEINTLLIEKFKAEKLRLGLSSKTINNHLATLSKALKCAFEWERMTTPVPPVQRLSVCTPKIDFLTPIESHQLLQDREEPMWNTMILVALRTGMRFGELLGLEWSDVNWSQRIVTVRQSLVRGVLGTPKSGKIRHIPLTDDALQRLVELPKTHARVFHEAGVSTHRVGANAIQRICKRTGVRVINWHLLRHTFASHLAMEGVPIPVVQQLLGHASITMTMRYAHLSPSRLGEAVEVLQRLEIRAVERLKHEAVFEDDRTRGATAPNITKF